ncbi:hypothetical protein SDC9_115828 [bioreactor metagenome]|uniref:Uncharacterized protein n=1 Tax=bioreactor metagenome TaxID=1076179 RepID=A0A645C0N8_9ZZZZ
MLGEQQRVFSPPAETRLQGEFDFHDRGRVGKDAVTERTDQGGYLVGEFLQAAADDLVIVAALRIAGNGCLFRLVDNVGVGQVVQCSADDGQRSRLQALGLGTQFGMAGHIIHGAMASLGQPGA